MNVALAGTSKLRSGTANELRDMVAEYGHFKNVHVVHYPAEPKKGFPERYEVKADSQFCEWTFLTEDEFHRAVVSIEQVVGPPDARRRR